jgi:hypothetical protein
VSAGRAPYVELWPALAWQRWLPNLAMPAAFVLAACGMGAAQPFTLGGRRADRFDPAEPGLAAVTRHPLLLALALWSGAHLAANGDLAHVVVFGGFFAMSLAAGGAGARSGAGGGVLRGDVALLAGAVPGCRLAPPHAARAGAAGGGGAGALGRGAHAARAGGRAVAAAGVMPEAAAAGRVIRAS